MAITPNLIENRDRDTVTFSIIFSSISKVYITDQGRINGTLDTTFYFFIFPYYSQLIYTFDSKSISQSYSI